MTFPDFLVIGAQKAGTSWLKHNLALQPRIWMPEVKELHWHGRHSGDLLRERLRSQRVSYRRARGMALGALRRPWRSDRRAELAWALRYLLLPRTERSYATLFPDDPTLVKGEATPDYARMPEPAIAQVLRSNPDLHVLYTIRNPIDRAWSQLNMYMQKHDPLLDLASVEGAAIAAKQATGLVDHCDYLTHLERWGRYTRPQRLHLMFFDDLAADPARFLRDACRCLGLADEEIVIPPDVEVARNSRSHPPTMPPAILEVLGPRVRELTLAQHAHFANAHTERWVASLEGAETT